MLVSTSAFTLVVLTGVGVAADRSVPGDLLHPVDRALEAVGLSTDLVEERLAEAIVLTDRGDLERAIATANEALDELGRSGVTASQAATTPTTGASDTAAVELDPTTTTTEAGTTLEAVVPADGEDAGQDEESADVRVEAARPVDAVAALRLAAEALLQSVRSAKTDTGSTDDVTTAAMFLAEATASATSEAPDLVTTTTTTSTPPSSSTSSTSSTTTTTTTAPDQPRGGGSGTTTTTVASDPDDGPGSDDPADDGEDASPGPIFLPTP